MPILPGLRFFWARSRSYAAQFTSGGRWSTEYPRPIRRNLRWFFFDGVFAAASEAVSATYMSLYLLALGATSAQIGLLSAFSNLAAALTLLPGALLADRTGKRKRIVLISGGGVSRIALLCLAILPFLLPYPAVVYVAILLRVIIDGSNNLAMPAWTSLIADMVPIEGRGRYFGARNLSMGVATILVTYFAGQLITSIGGLRGYQIAFGFAFLIGLVATYCYARIQEPPIEKRVTTRFAPLLKSYYDAIRLDRNFLAYCLQTSLFHISLYIAAPFFSVYLVQNLQASAVMVGILSIVTSISGIPFQSIFGHLSDKWGPRRVQLITGFLVPILPLTWLLVSEPWQVVPINVLSGIFWAGYSLAAFNFLLVLAPPGAQARYMAIFQLTVVLSSAIGSFLGGMVVSYWGILFTFAASGIGRFIAAFIYAQFVKNPQPALQVDLPSPPSTTP